MVSLKTLGFIATNKAGDIPTSCGKYSVLVSTKVTVNVLRSPTKPAGLSPQTWLVMDRAPMKNAAFSRRKHSWKCLEVSLQTPGFGRLGMGLAAFYCSHHPQNALQFICNKEMQSELRFDDDSEQFHDDGPAPCLLPVKKSFHL